LIYKADGIAGLPSTLVAYTNILDWSPVGDFELKQVGLNVPLPAGDYWIGWSCLTITGPTGAFGENTGGTMRQNTGWPDPPPNPFGTALAGHTYKMSVWAVIGPPPPPPPDPPMIDFAALYPNAIGEEACSVDFAPLRDMHGDPDNTLCTYLHGLAGMYKPIDDIAKDGPNGEPGWSQIFDLERAKTEWLPWAGQLVGYSVPQRASNQSLAVYDVGQRERIITRSAYRRGEISLLSEVIAEQLNPPKRLRIFERDGGDPFLITVYIMFEDIATSIEEITRAAQSQKIAGLIMNIRTIHVNDVTYDMLRFGNTDYQQVKTDHATYQTVKDHPG